MAKTLNFLSYLLIFCCLGLTNCNNPRNVVDSSNQAGTNISATTTKQSIGQKLRENNHLPVAKRVALYHRLKKENPNGYNFGNEDDMTMYGYSLLWNNKPAEALEIFKLIVSEFPNSSNPYDSLGEGWLVNGDKEKALANYEKSLAMNPENYNAIDQIQRIKGTYKEPERIEDKFDKIYKVNEYRNDFDQLGHKLAEIHPNVFKFISEEDFWNLVEEKKTEITDQTTYAEFAWMCSEIVASINCAHTSSGGFFPEWKMLPEKSYFPMKTRWMNEALYVVDPLVNQNKVSVKDKILKINGVAVSDLVKEIYKHIPSQGYIETYKKHQLNKWVEAMIPYALSFPETYEIIVERENEPIELQPVQLFPKSFVEPYETYCPDRLCLDFMDEDQTAVLTIASFNYYWWANLDEFINFIDESFEEINKKNVKNLIIDLRYNGGGSYHSSIHLLKYLIDKPFTYYSNVPLDEGEGIHYPFENTFKGNLYFLIDGNGNSTTGHFMSIVKDLDLGTIIGEELGSNQFCTAGQAICRLPNTGLEYYVANSTCISSATSFPPEKGIMPDYEVSQSIDDYVNDVDRVKEFALDLIKK